MSLTYSPSDLPPTPEGRRRWTRDECRFLENVGFLQGRYELIDGEIVSKMGQNRRHALTVMLLIEYLLKHFGPRRVQTQATMEVREADQVTNRPEPDVLVLQEYVERVPTGRDALLIVEVSDSTQGDDFGFKTGLYARAGVAEYWVVDLSRRVLVTFRSPDPSEGVWRVRAEFREGDRVCCQAAPGSETDVRDLLPPDATAESAAA